MAPKGGNAKKESGRAKKAANSAEKEKKTAAEQVIIEITSFVPSDRWLCNSQERKEEDNWKDTDVKGGKSKQEDKEEKRKADLARKAENARLLAEEEAAVSAKPKPAKKKGAKDVKPAGPGAIAAGGGLSPEPEVDGRAEVESYAATGIDNALDLLEVVTAKMDKASVGQQAANIESHPEVSICIIFLPRRSINETYSAASRYI